MNFSVNFAGRDVSMAAEETGAAEEKEEVARAAARMLIMENFILNCVRWSSNVLGPLLYCSIYTANIYIPSALLMSAKGSFCKPPISHGSCSGFAPVRYPNINSSV